MLLNLSPEFQGSLKPGFNVIGFDGFEIGQIWANNKGKSTLHSRKSILPRHPFTSGESKVLTFNSVLR